MMKGTNGTISPTPALTPSPWYVVTGAVLAVFVVALGMLMFVNCLVAKMLARARAQQHQRQQELAQQSAASEQPSRKEMQVQLPVANVYTPQANHVMEDTDIEHLPVATPVAEVPAGSAVVTAMRLN